MDDVEIKAVEMVRAIRDQIREETRDMTREEYLAYIRRSASRVLDEAAAKRGLGTEHVA
jgi:predicted transcriptional regulator